MTRRMLFFTAAICAIFCCAALAADISGNWSGTMQMGDQPLMLTFAFKQDGEKLTGTVAGPTGEPLALKEGKITGDKMSFSVQADMGGNPTKFVSEGVVKGEEITLTIKIDGGGVFGGGPMTLKRAK